MTISPKVQRPVIETKNNLGFLGNISIPSKLLLLTSAVGIPALVLSVMLASGYIGEYQRSNIKANVATAFSPLQFMQQSTRIIQGRQPGDVTPEMIDNFTKASAKVIESAKASNIPEALKLSDDIALKSKQVLDGLNGHNITFKDLLDITTSILVNDVNPLFSVLSSQGGLLASNNTRDFEMAELSSRLLPTIFPATGRQFDSILAISEKARLEQSGHLTDAQRVDIQDRLDSIRSQLDQIDTYSKTVMQKYPDLIPKLNDNYRQALGITRGAFDSLDNGIIKTAKITTPAKEFLKLPIQYLPLQYKAFSATVDAMSEGFRNTSNSARNKLIGLLVLLLLLATLISILISTILRSIMQPLEALTTSAQRLSAGDFNVKVPVTSKEELGTLSRAFNSAAEQLQANEVRVKQEREEAARLQGNIGEFLDITMDIAEGDLTKRGKVTEDVLGNVVDSINLMTEELGVVLKDVQSASNSVTGGSRAMLSTTEQIDHGARLTVSEAGRVAQQAQELTAAIRVMAQNAQTSAETARQALVASQQGQEAVTGTLEGMQNIRSASQNVAEQIQGLSRRSDQIQEIVESISHIASQTNLLALHASIEAAGAGEAGQRFTIVAQEVSQLADLSAQEAQRITSLVRNVQNEISTALATVNESTREVEQGYRVAGTAGERLREIGTLSERSAQLAEQISEATQEQVRGIEQMGQAVAQINNIAQDSAQSVEEGRAAAEQLQQLATQLNSSLSRFRLPA